MAPETLLLEFPDISYSDSGKNLECPDARLDLLVQAYRDASWRYVASIENPLAASKRIYEDCRELMTCGDFVFTSDAIKTIEIGRSYILSILFDDRNDIGPKELYEAITLSNEAKKLFQTIAHYPCMTSDSFENNEAKPSATSPSAKVSDISECVGSIVSLPAL
ncbi:hypothetical protein C8Q75DRAFT_809902 [Abortiporus biennis]|nr:hypothetical protein C8Q75DRAFT_809902 [Abortiporus biennis]